MRPIQTTSPPQKNPTTNAPITAPYTGKGLVYGNGHREISVTWSLLNANDTAMTVKANTNAQLRTFMA